MSKECYIRVKRAADAFFAVGGLIVTAPLQAAVALAVVCDLGRPVLFRQLRPGRDGRIFTLVKFRTMRHPVAAGTGSDEPNDAERLTRLGKALRATSLDELPTLWNVVTGDMSFVGPRPLLPEYLERYDERQRRRHEVRPGITGLAQVSGRNSLPWEERFELDVQYVEQMNVRMDLRVLVRTVGSVLLRKGIAEKGNATMSVFRGAEMPAPRESHKAKRAEK